MDKLYSKKFVCLVHVFLVNRVCNVLILLPIRIFLMSVCNVFTILQVKKKLSICSSTTVTGFFKIPKECMVSGSFSTKWLCQRKSSLFIMQIVIPVAKC